MRSRFTAHSSPLAERFDHAPGRDGRGASARGARRGERGLTLIEIMIALGIIVVLLAAVVMSLDAVTGARAKKTAGTLSAVMRALYDEAALSGRTCRLVLVLPGEKDEEASVTYRAECAERAIAARRDRDEELREATEAAKEKNPGQRAQEDAYEFREQRDYSLTNGPSLDELLSAERKEVERSVQFGAFTSDLLDEPQDIPPEVKVSVWTKGQKEAAKSGIAYLYFHPQGYTERAMIFIEQGPNAWTIKLSPLTGKTQIVSEKLEIPNS